MYAAIKRSRHLPLGLGNEKPHADAGGERECAVDKTSRETQVEEHGRRSVACRDTEHGVDEESDGPGPHYLSASRLHL